MACTTQEVSFFRFIHAGRVDKVREMIPKMNLNMDTLRFGSPLFQACKSPHEGRYEVARLLLEMGAHPNRKCCHGMPLLEAEKKGDMRLVHLLIEAGADPTLGGTRTPPYEYYAGT